MATKKVTTNIVVQFDAGDSDGILTVEIDDREDGPNGGKTSFMPGDPVYLLRYMTSNVTLAVDGAASYGTCGSVGDVSITKTEDIVFAGETSATLQYPCTGDGSGEWVGTEAGAVSRSGNTLTLVSESKYPIGVYRYTYPSAAQSYKLTHSALSAPEYSIALLWVGTAK